jgi:hypothetical protein
MNIKPGPAIAPLSSKAIESRRNEYCYKWLNNSNFSLQFLQTRKLLLPPILPYVMESNKSHKFFNISQKQK